ncbi:MAG: hypothetical protein WCB99_05655 [Candidatus Cybelea sp.]
MMLFCGLDHLWSALQGIGAIAVAVAAIFGLVAAFRQIEALKTSRTETATIARTQRTTELLAEFGSEDMEYRCGFFDAAYDVSDSREIFNNLYDEFVRATRRKLRAMDRTECFAAVRKESTEFIDYQLDPDGDATPIKKSDRATVCKNEIISIANLCKRAWVLMERARLMPSFCSRTKLITLPRHTSSGRTHLLTWSGGAFQF